VSQSTLCFDIKKVMKKEIGIIGLGKMGGGLASQWRKKGWKVIGYDKSGRGSVKTIANLFKKLSGAKVIWLMLPHQVVDDTISELIPFLKKGDTVIDGGNSNFKETLKRAEKLKILGINFLDAGVSGGPGGAKSGACVMVGGNKKVFKKYELVFKDIALDYKAGSIKKNSYEYCGESGAGHFVKMIHNGIEYGMMQAIAEGFEVLKSKEFSGKKMDLLKIASLYNNGSVVASSLVGWLLAGYKKFGTDLKDCSSEVGHSGEAEWTVQTAKEMGILTPVIAESLNFRKKSKQNPRYSGRVLSAMRNMFGGHEVASKK
jgi:6-phosphogluconate dehydrogenase